MQAVRRHMNGVVRLCLALVLFGQFTLAAQACAPVQGMPLQAAPSHHCHEDQGSPTRDTACLMHCLQGDQAPVPAGVLPMAQFADAPSVIPVVAPAVAWQPHLLKPQTLALDSGPPIPIRYCRFLN